MLASVFNVIGAVVSTKVAKTVGNGVIATPHGHDGLLVVFAALVGAIAWNLITWKVGLPSSSTHALIGGLVGAALVASVSVHWSELIERVIVPLIATPLIGLVGGYLAMVAILWTIRQWTPAKVNRRFRWTQRLSAAAMAFGHGTHDAQKTMGVVTLALLVTGHVRSFSVPVWVVLSAAAAMGVGTVFGGWRIINTVGKRITPLDPPRGFAAESAASAVLLVSAYAFAAPVSSTYLITSSVMGVGATRRLSSVRWLLARSVLIAWGLTLPGAAAVASVAYVAVRAVTG